MIELSVSLLESYNLWLQSEDLSKRSRLTYYRCLFTIFNQCEGVRVMHYLMDRELTNRYNKINAFKKYLEFLYDEDIITSNTYLKVKKKFKFNRQKRAKNIKAYPSEEWVTIRKKFPKGFGEFAAWFVLHTGLRVGELCGLKVSDIDLEKKRIYIRSNEVIRIKGEKERVLPISSKQAVKIEEFLVHRTSMGVSHEFLLYNSRKGRLHIRQFQKYCKNAGVRAHDLRRSFLTDYVKKNGNIKDAQFLAGHSKSEQTEKYILVSEDEMLDRIRRRLD